MVNPRLSTRTHNLFLNFLTGCLFKQMLVKNTILKEGFFIAFISLNTTNPFKTFVKSRIVKSFAKSRIYSILTQFWYTTMGFLSNVLSMMP